MAFLKRRCLTIFLVAFLFFTLTGKNAHAWAPIMEGIVRVKETQAPIPGVWVKWHDLYGGERYEQTDPNGMYSFASWDPLTQEERQKEYDTMIDSDLDGVADVRKSSVSRNAYFGCASNPHTFSLIVPKFWTGNTDNSRLVIPEVNFSNGIHSITVPPLEYSNPTVLPTPTVTPTVTITITPSPSPTPTPTVFAPSPTPTPTRPPAVCDCDNVTFDTVPTRGQNVTFTGFAKVTDTGTNGSEASSMNFRFQRLVNASTNQWEDYTDTSGQAYSATRPVVGVTYTPNPTPPTTKRYASQWSLSLPNTIPAGTYRVEVDQIACRHTTQALGRTVSGRAVLAATDDGSSGVGSFLQFLGALFGFTSKPVATPTPVPGANIQSQGEAVPFVVVAPQNSRSIQLGTFTFVSPTPRVVPGCTGIEFEIL